MKSINKTWTFILAATGAFFPLPALSANGSITSSLIGMVLALSVIGYKTASKVYYDTLPSNTQTFLRYNLTRGYNYNMVASCDTDECQDLDLILYDPAGNKVDSAESNKTNEKVGLLVRESGTHTLQVIMRGCSQASCEYGVQLLYQEK